MEVLPRQAEPGVLEGLGRGATGTLKVEVALELEVRELSWTPFLQMLKVY